MFCDVRSSVCCPQPIMTSKERNALREGNCSHRRHLMRTHPSFEDQERVGETNRAITLFISQVQATKKREGGEGGRNRQQFLRHKWMHKPATGCSWETDVLSWWSAHGLKQNEGHRILVAVCASGGGSVDGKKKKINWNSGWRVKIAPHYGFHSAVRLACFMMI